MNLALADTELPVRLRFERSFTDDELARFCSDNEPYRVERDANGELVLMSPVTSEGGAIEGDVFLELGNWAKVDGRGKHFGPNAGFTLPDSSVRAADASWISFERWSALTATERKGFACITPEFVIEVRSESDRLRPLREKMETWIHNGAKLGWMVDPLRRVVEAYRLGEEPEIHENPISVQGTGPVCGFELVMSRVWG